jgi:hypothetical protein
VIAGEESPGEADGTSGEAEDPAAAVLSRRDELLGPVVTKLARSIKRALQDDQNDLLDKMRHAASTATLEELRSLREQEQRFEEAAREAIAEARQSGVDFAVAAVQSNGAASATVAVEDAGEVNESSCLLAAELVGALRQRITAGLAELAGIRDGVVPDLIGSAYRELKGSRVEELAGDHATRAFAGGQVAALQADGEKVLVTWIVDDGGKPCPDCDDNALAGPQAPGEPFPTGQLHPPVHPGCRCLLVAEP